jgi:hypothetical protein
MLAAGSPGGLSCASVGEDGITCPVPGNVSQCLGYRGIRLLAANKLRREPRTDILASGFTVNGTRLGGLTS